MNNEEKILAMLEQMQGEMADMKANMATKNEVAALRVDVGELQKGQKSIRGDIGNLFQNHDKHMKIINEGLGHLNDRYAQLDKVEKQTDDHDNRIFALEQKAANT